ncbi:Uncharacterized protein TCM_045401 isoform 1 [Theobroma cacao]|uniref:Uncharacterized protein isoform 1 n=1 Tax=Theobroma cacao TaxID=3641 RepID=A0A061FSD1_THECC|nr:Uncharacterized protein TCM_045401 isoform 1 [Theobroma cacao]EOY20000.1 Uncharacterized protein TCM_045401 isoform 1 [Theobroma cacao]EOY20001.1 Uncharacterized protein TCM_045401 isoform 1 [Theobroma cacao]
MHKGNCMICSHLLAFNGVRKEHAKIMSISLTNLCNEGDYYEQVHVVTLSSMEDIYYILGVLKILSNLRILEVIE